MALEQTVSRRSPRIARIVIMGQTIMIVLLSLVMFREFQSNPYLHDYVNSEIQTGLTAETVFGLILIGVFASGLFTITVAWKYGQTLPLTPHVSRTLPVRTIPLPGLNYGSKDDSRKTTVGTVLVASTTLPVSKQIEQGQGSPDRPSP